MSSLAPLQWAVVALVVLGMVLATRSARRYAPAPRAGLLLVQPIAAALLLALLLAPAAEGPRRLHVFTEGARVPASPLDAPAIALPGAPDVAGAELWPDLAAALRQRPQALHLIVHGHGLDAHDRDAVGTSGVTRVPGAPLAGLVELEAPSQVQAGALWRVAGQVRSSDGQTSANDGADVDPELRVELLAPSGAVLQRTVVDRSGRFELHGMAPIAGTHEHALRVLRGDTLLQLLPLPVHARAAAPQRALLLAGAPSPELKHLRRWARDAGLALDARVALAPGLQLRTDGAAALQPAALRSLDVLIVDERSWPQLRASLDEVREAVSDGMGLLLRVTGPVPPDVARDWARLGLPFAFDGDAPGSVRLREPLQATDDDAPLHAWPVRVSDDDAAALVHAADGAALGVWRASGRGRVGMLWLADSYALRTRGDAAAHATLWSGIWSRLARADRRAAPVVSLPAVVGWRSIVCGGDGAGLRVAAPDGRTRELLRDPRAGDCAAFYPTMTGWHRVVSAAAGTEAETLFNALAPADLAAVRARQRIDATEALAAASGADGPGQAAAPSRLAPWADRSVLMALWLAAMVLAWWLERRARSRNALQTEPAARRPLEPSPR